MSESKSTSEDALDLQARNRIESELDRNFLVEAAAGTGKTTSMVNRMVALVATGTCSIQQVAAVTFTRKAAAELRERFQAELRRRAVEASKSSTLDPEVAKRLAVAADDANQAFVGTIHSFCAALLRERPIEFGVDPSFRELDESEDRLLREQAWYGSIDALIASGDPLIKKLHDLDLERSQLKDCYDRFIEYRDIEDWPSSIPTEIDLEGLKKLTREYIEDMRGLLPFFPAERGKDKLMNRYEAIVRASSRSWTQPRNFFALLEQFDTSPGERQLDWPKKDIVGIDKLGKRERDRWLDFREKHVTPAFNYWYRLRYSYVVDFVRRAVKTYERLKRANGGLDFQDLLLRVSVGLQSQPGLRRYFQNRYSRLLVDEFQDTDPIQAQMMLYLTSSNTDQTDWTQCVPKPGSLFLVGDPKQSIYRFRRGDIVTFNRVKAIIAATGGEVLALRKNFRSRENLIQWNNRIYQSKFDAKPNPYSPAPEDMLCGRTDVLSPSSADLELSGIYRLTLPTDLNAELLHELEAESIAKFIRHAIDSGMQVHRTKRESDHGLSTAARAGDFLIVPWGKKRINLLVAALQKYGIPYEVAGGNPLKDHSQLRLLIDCLRAIDDPSHPVHYLALLRDFFGLNDRELFLFKQAGGSFNYTAPVPRELDETLYQRFCGITAQLQAYQRWLRSLPYAVAVSRIGEDLGLFAHAAASAEGNMQAGGLFKAIEWLREQSWNFDSATDMIQFIEDIQTQEDSDGCPALPSDGNAVRIMNLHKAKGLESPIVFLTDNAGRNKGEVRCHIDRSGANAVGYMGITVKVNDYQFRDVATPENWVGFQEEEGRYLAAEFNRLLYVATTRAGCALIVSSGNEKSNWAALGTFLQDAPELKVPSDAEIVTAGRATATHSSTPLAHDTEQINAKINAKWSTGLEPSYEVVSAKKLGLKGKSRPKWEASGDFGYLWGSAVHELLEVCHRSPTIDLRPTAVRLTQQYDLGIERVDSLIETVQAVSRSEVWRRAQASQTRFSELPFETLVTNGDGTRTIVRGVIDLIFEESSASSSRGWVIVDYKTDDIEVKDIPSAIDYYRAQLIEYAKHWNEITGFECKELGLYFTKLNRYESITTS